MKINFFCPINNLGYGRHSYETMLAMDRLGHQLTLTTPSGRVEFESLTIKGWLENSATFDRRDPSVMIFHEEYLTRFCGTPRIGFPVFETDDFSPHQLAGLRSCDLLFTPSEWGRGVLAMHGFTNTYIVPEGIDPDLFKARFEPRDDVFTFVHVGKYEERKGTLQIIRCFYEALERYDAELIMHIDNPFADWREPCAVLLRRLGFSGDGKSWRNAGLSVRFTNFTAEHKNVAALYSLADCGLYPSKAEGWGLPIQETIACGVPCIVGKWTGQTEYLNESGYPPELLIHDPKYETANDGVWYHGNRGGWFVSRDDEVIEHMRWAFTNARKLRGEMRWKETVDHVRGFTWERAAREMERSLGLTLQAG